MSDNKFVMKISNAFKQNSREWYAFRGTGLGASDAPAIMSVSPWKTRFELWAEKTKLLSPSEAHPMAVAAMNRGKELEGPARNLYMKQTGLKVDADVNVEHPEHSFIRASLDGITPDRKIIQEIKSPGKKDLEEAAKGKIPKKYYWQLMQQLMLVPEAERLDYITYDGKETLYIVQVKRDQEAEKKLLKELTSFWKLVETQTPPGVDGTDLDRIVQRISKEFERLSQSMKALTLLNDVLLRAQSNE